MYVFLSTMKDIYTIAKIEYFIHFLRLDQLVPVPSIFFIGDSGTPLEIIGNALSPTDLVAKIDSILLKANASASLIDVEQAHSSTNSQATDQSQAKSTESAASDPSQTAEDSSNYATDPNLTAEERVAAAISHEVIELSILKFTQLSKIQN